MAKSLRSFPEHERGKVAIRRITNKTLGLGYWAAMDYTEKKNTPKKEEIK